MVGFVGATPQEIVPTLGEAEVLAALSAVRLGHLLEAHIGRIQGSPTYQWNKNVICSGSILYRSGAQCSTLEQREQTHCKLSLAERLRN